MKAALWHTEFADPMPEGTTYLQFMVKREKKDVGESIRWQLDFIYQLEALPKTEVALEWLEMEREKLDELYKEKIKLEMGW